MAYKVVCLVKAYDIPISFNVDSDQISMSVFCFT
jgi:hypothetical protein